jgi:hypothetical protein
MITVRKRHWIVIAVAVIALLTALLFIASYFIVRYKDIVYINHVLLNTQNIAKACREYSKHPAAAGRFPGKLHDLISPPFEAKSFIDGGRRAIIDPWGKPYKYAIVPNPDGVPEVYIWTDWADDRAITLRGAKVTAEGEIVLFGRP